MSDRRSSGWKRFIKLTQSTESSAELEEVLIALFTPEEKQQLALRVELIRELLKGEKPQRDIAQQLGVSIATITRGSNMLKTIRPKLKEFLKQALSS